MQFQEWGFSNELKTADVITAKKSHLAVMNNNLTIISIWHSVLLLLSLSEKSLVTKQIEQTTFFPPSKQVVQLQC